MKAKRGEINVNIPQDLLDRFEKDSADFAARFEKHMKDVPDIKDETFDAAMAFILKEFKPNA
jgi:hypothetical protein